MLQPVYKYQIAERLRMSRKTFERKLKAANIDIPRGLISPKIQEIIYKKLGYESIWEEIVEDDEMENNE